MGRSRGARGPGCGRAAPESSRRAAAALVAGALCRRSAASSHSDEPSARDALAHVSSITYGSADTGATK